MQDSNKAEVCTGMIRWWRIDLWPLIEVKMIALGSSGPAKNKYANIGVGLHVMYLQFGGVKDL